MTKARQASSTLMELPGAEEAREETLPVPSRSVPVADGEEGGTYQSKLGMVNRHWYRRRLDALDKILRGASRNPSIEESSTI